MSISRPPMEVLREGGVLRGADLEGFGGDHFAASLLGLVIDEVSLQRVAAHLDCDQRHQQPYGIVHGGVWCSVVESLASVGAAMHVLERDQHVVGVNNTTDFLRAHGAGRVEAVAEPVHVGRSQQLWQVRIHRAEDGKALARGQVRLQNVDTSRSLGGVPST